MTGGTRLALGMAGGYVLGRFRKTRWIALLAAGLVTKKVADELGQRGASKLGSSPELTKLAEQGREAAVAILGGRIKGLTERIHARTESLRQPGGPGRAEGEQATEGEGGPAPEPEAEDGGTAGADGPDEPGDQAESEASAARAEPEEPTARADEPEPGAGQDGDAEGGAEPEGDETPGAHLARRRTTDPRIRRGRGETAPRRSAPTRRRG